MERTKTRFPAAVDLLVVVMEVPREHEPNIELARYLRDEGVKAGFVTRSVRAARLIGEAGFPAWPIRELIKATGTPDLRPEAVEELELRYGLLSLRDLCLPEARALGIPEEQLYEKGLRYLAAFEEVFQQQKPAMVVQNSGAELLRRTAFFVARRQSIHHIFLRPTPFPFRLTFSIDSEAGDWTGLHFDAPDRPADETLAAARSFVAEYRQGRLSSGQVRRPRLSWQRFVTWLRLVWWRFREEREPGERWNPLWRARKYLVVLLRGFLQKLLYQSPNWDEPFVLYPMHVWHDSAITVRAPQFLRQQNLVETIADAMPQGCKLYVKEHPSTVGWNPLRAMLQLRRLGNVVLLDPGTSNHEIVARARAVLVINSTAGFEALAYHKPVIVLGKPFYSGRGVTVDVSDLFDLRAAIRTALRQPVQGDRIDQFLYQAARQTIPGSLIVIPSDLKNLAAGLVAHGLQCGLLPERRPTHVS